MTRRSFSQLAEITHDVHHFGINNDTREIFVGGYIDGEDEIDYRSAIQLIKNLRILDIKPGKIIIHLSIMGGVWEYGIAIFDAINACHNKVITISHAHARSMSSIVPQAADIRIIMPHALFMVHEGTIEVDATSKSATALIEQNNKTIKQC
jgi:ATP-dependent protease ClpP protease subunit